MNTSCSLFTTETISVPSIELAITLEVKQNEERSVKVGVKMKAEGTHEPHASGLLGRQIQFAAAHSNRTVHIIKIIHSQHRGET